MRILLHCELKRRVRETSDLALIGALVEDETSALRIANMLENL